eukprot:6350376-Heterocapsa_arctica.AAC.1
MRQLMCRMHLGAEFVSKDKDATKLTDVSQRQRAHRSLSCTILSCVPQKWMIRSPPFFWDTTNARGMALR